VVREPDRIWRVPRAMLPCLVRGILGAEWELVNCCWPHCAGSWRLDECSLVTLSLSYRVSIQAFSKLVTQLIPAFFFESPVWVV
jgi:hypothetical protein